jgi:phosphinothricin acetyltransferase
VYWSPSSIAGSCFTLSIAWARWLPRDDALRRVGEVEQIAAWLDGRHPVVVVEDRSGAVIAFASSSSYRSRSCYAGIAEFSVYVARRRRDNGAECVAMNTLVDATTKAGFTKLVSRVFPEDRPSLVLMAALGFREVGVYQRGKLDGQWRDCVTVERFTRRNSARRLLLGRSAIGPQRRGRLLAHMSAVRGRPEIPGGVLNRRE